MGSIDRFLAKPVRKQIEGEEIDIWPLTVDDVDVVTMTANPDKAGEATRQIVKRSLKRSFPDATDEQVRQVRFTPAFMNEYLNAVLEASGLEADKKKLEQMTAAFLA